MNERTGWVAKTAVDFLRGGLGAWFSPRKPRVNRNSIFFKAACFIAADKVGGDFLEFGTFSGNSFITAYHAMELAYRELTRPGVWNSDKDCRERAELWSNTRFFAFDSFQGLPELTGIDTQTTDYVLGKYANSQANFEKALRTGMVPLDRVRIVPGWFNESLTETTIRQHGMKTAAIVHVDVDLYESSKTVLSFITPLLVEGSIIIFDDWYNYRGSPHLGEQRACNEWLAQNPEWQLVEYQKEGPWRNSFIAAKRGPATSV